MRTNYTPLKVSGLKLGESKNSAVASLQSSTIDSSSLETEGRSANVGRVGDYADGEARDGTGEISDRSTAEWSLEQLIRSKYVNDNSEEIIPKQIQRQEQRDDGNSFKGLTELISRWSDTGLLDGGIAADKDQLTKIVKSSMQEILKLGTSDEILLQLKALQVGNYNTSEFAQIINAIEERIQCDEHRGDAPNPYSSNDDNTNENVSVFSAATPAAGLRDGTDSEDLFLVEDVIFNRGTSDIATMGLDLPVNTREALKYRIRRKRNLTTLILRLGSLYLRLDERGRTSVDSGPANSDGSDICDREDYGDLLPPTIDDRAVRRAKIREFLDEVSGKSSSKISSMKESELLALSKSLSSKWADRGIAL